MSDAGRRSTGVKMLDPQEAVMQAIYGLKFRPDMSTGAIISELGLPGSDRAIVIKVCPLGTIPEYQSSDSFVSHSIVGLSGSVQELLSTSCRTKITIGVRCQGELHSVELSIKG